MDDRERLIVLNAIPDIGTIRVRRLLESFGTLRELFAAGEARLQQVEGIGPVLARRIASACQKTQLAAEELQLAKDAGCSVVTMLDDGYPTPLKNLPDPPLVLYMKGAWVEQDRTAVAIVGSRRASIYGQQVAQRLAYDLAMRGITVVSGLARGIDSAAHQGALKASGRTIAVLGNGLSRIYPPEHEGLAERIVAQGAVMSEYPMQAPPLAQHFPQRNRLISGLSLGVVIVEAAKRSGALITADCALEQGREVFAVPGTVDSVTSQGTHQLLKQGARLVTSVDDILEELRLEPREPRPDRPASSPDQPATPVHGLTEQEQRLFESLSAHEPRDLDSLAAHSGISAAASASLLLQLELKHLVKQLPGKRFVRVC